MPEHDPFASWLDEFKKQVDATVVRAGPATSPEAQSAQAAFDIWWKAEQQPIELTAQSLGPLERALPEPAARPRLLAEEWPTRMERLVEDKAKLQGDADRLGRENAELRARQAKIQSEIAELGTKLSRSRDDYEGHISRLEHERASLEQRAAALEKDKDALAGALKAISEQSQRFENDAKLERDRAALAERSGAELRSRVAELEKRLAALSEHNAAQLGAVEELRRQASVYQERLVDAKERTDNDLLGLRQDIKWFVEELRIVTAGLRAMHALKEKG